MVGIVILNYNNARMTLNCIRSVLLHNSFPAKYVVIDNASTDDSVEFLDNELAEIFGNGYCSLSEEVASEFARPYSCILLKSSHNGGYAKGNNIGLYFLEKDDDIDSILILNNDILFVDDIIPKLKTFLDINVDAGIASPLLLKKDMASVDYNCARLDCSLREIVCYYLFYCRDFKGILSRFAEERNILANNPSLLKEDAVPIELPSGSCMMIRKELFQKLGYFDPHTFLYYEEGILFRKLNKLGMVNYVLPGLRCVHLGAQTTGKVERNYSYLKYSNKSAYYYVMHYRGLNLFQRIGFSALYGAYSCALYLRQHLKAK